MITLTKEQLSQYNYSDIYDYNITDLLLRLLPYEDTKISKKVFDFINKDNIWIYIHNNKLIIEKNNYANVNNYIYDYLESIVKRTVKCLK